MNVRIGSLIACLAAVAGLLSGCGSFSPDTAKKTEYEKLWAVEFPAEGFARAGASRVIDRQSEYIHISYSIAPGEYAQAPQQGMKRVAEGGREFLYGESAVCWDGVDENGNPTGGTQYSRRLLWERGGCSCYVFAETGREDAFSVYEGEEGSLRVASAEMALRLETDPLAELNGFAVKSDIAWVSFKNDYVTVDITLYSPRYDSDIVREFAASDVYTLRNEAGTEYYTHGGGSKPDEPMVSTLLWRTDKGVICLNAGVPWINRDDVPQDALDFVNLQLAKSITEQLGGKIVQFE